MKVTVTGFLHWTCREWDDSPHYDLWPCDMSKTCPEHVFIEKHELEFEIPDDFDPVPHQVAALRQKKQEILAEAQVKVNNLEEQIQRLLALEYKPEMGMR